MLDSAGQFVRAGDEAIRVDVLVPKQRVLRVGPAVADEVVRRIVFPGAPVPRMGEHDAVQHGDVGVGLIIGCEDHFQAVIRTRVLPIFIHPLPPSAMMDDVVERAESGGLGPGDPIVGFGIAYFHGAAPHHTTGGVPHAELARFRVPVHRQAAHAPFEIDGFPGAIGLQNRLAAIELGDFSRDAFDHAFFAGDDHVVVKRLPLQSDRNRLPVPPRLQIPDSRPDFLRGRYGNRPRRRAHGGARFREIKRPTPLQCQDAPPQRQAQNQSARDLHPRPLRTRTPASGFRRSAPDGPVPICSRFATSNTQTGQRPFLSKKLLGRRPGLTHRVQYFIAQKRPAHRAERDSKNALILGCGFSWRQESNSFSIESVRMSPPRSFSSRRKSSARTEVISTSA